MIRDREELEKLAGSQIDIPQRYLDVHDFFFGPTLDGEAYDILRRYRADYLMVYAAVRSTSASKPCRASPR